MASVCRTCLSFSNKMHDLRDSQLQETFERVTNRGFNAGLALCYLCYAQLRKCCKFADMSWKSEVILTELVNKGVEINQETISRFGMTKTSTFSVTPVDYFYSGFKDSSEAVVKADTAITKYEVLVKEEIIEKEDAYVQRLKEVTEHILKEELEELCLEEDNNTEGEVTINEYCKSEETIPFEYIDIECNEKDDLPISNTSNNKEKLLYNCNICCKTFNMKGNLKRHMQVHARENYTCDYCKRSFNSKDLIQKHITIHTQKKLHKCILCEKTFRLERYLKEHLKIHAKEKLYICHLCGKAFTDKTGLNRHSNTHAEIRKMAIKTYDCNICNKKFYRNAHLELHMRIHTKLKPYTCSVCNHSCTQKCSLKEHMRIHTDERRHYCTECNKGFLRKGHLRQHWSVHTREKLKLNRENV